MNDRLPLLSTKVQLAPVTFFSVTTRMPWSVPEVIVAQLDIAQPANAAMQMHFNFHKTSMLLCRRKLYPVQSLIHETGNKQALRVLILVSLGGNNMQYRGQRLPLEWNDEGKSGSEHNIRQYQEQLCSEPSCFRYRLSRPIPRLGIAMPVLVAPFTAAITA
ncbi:MAG: hypothetical protein WBQ78_11475, partial [Gammaproteobacteria bacterium]